MNDFKIETESFPPRADFDGINAGGPSNYGGGHAKEIKDLAVKIRGEYELHYIPLDSEVSWMAGKTYIDVIGGTDEQKEQFSNNGPYAMTDEEPRTNRTYLGTAEQWAAIEKEFEWVEGWWTDQLGPEPDVFEDAIRNYANGAKALYDESTGVEAAGPSWADADRAIDLWISDAADVFRSNMWHRMPNIIRRQASVAGVLAHAMAAERDAWVQQRRTLEKIANKTKAALNAVKVEAPDNANGELTVLAGVATIAAGLLAIPTGGASLAALGVAGATIGAGVFTVAAGEAAISEGERQKVDLGDDTVSGVLLNMASAGGYAMQRLRDDEDLIITGLQAVEDRMTDNSSQERENDIPEDEYPKGSSPGEFGERTWTPAEKFVLPKPNVVDGAKNLPEPPIAT